MEHGALVLACTDGTRRTLVATGVRELAAFADQIWSVGAAGLERWTLDGRALAEPITLRGPGLLAPALTGGAAAVWLGDEPRMWLDDLGTFREVPVAAATTFVFAGRRQVLASHAEVRLGAVGWSLPAGGKLVGAAALFDGAGVVLIVKRGASVESWTSTAAGTIQHRITLPGDTWRLAARRGLMLVQTSPREITAIDLRFGRVLGQVAHDADIADLAIDREGTLLAIRTGADVSVVALRDAMRTPVRAPDDAVIAAATSEPALALATATAVEPPRPLPPRSPVVRGPRPVVQLPIALDALLPRAERIPMSRADATARLDRELELVAGWALVAIAKGWDTRRIGYPNESAHPHEHEVAAILGMNTSFAVEHLAAARDEAEARAAALHADPDRRGPTTPLAALAAELALSPLAIDILLVVAAPTIWGDAARLYGILANDPGRPTVDEHLVATILGVVSPHDIAHELDARAPLVRSGAIQIASDRPRPFATLAIDPVIVARLRAELPDLGGAVTVRSATVGLAGLELAPGVLLSAVTALAARGETPARIDVRGRPGTGRRTLLAALAAAAHRELAVIDATWLPRPPDAFTAALRTALRRIHLAGLVPCIAGLDQISFGERTVADVVGDVLRAHPGPLALVGPAGVAAPFDPGHLSIDLAVLDETERLELWQRALAAAGLWVRDAAALAARYRVGPGVIHRAIAAASSTTEDASDAIEGYIRQTRDARLAVMARRVERTATWSSLVLPPDIVDSLRELIGRVRHRRLVYEDWGMGEALTTARGITALFQGQPGTGKTLVAGVIARELGLDLYQVDLSKVMSKWIGETERNLATIFDAAEDGQAILLFDEADSLFAKRTEVRSSNDRYANLEVNYLLQRLDSFGGIAILTTNFGGSIDPAFKRRLSFRLSFPFPDEETRQQLWRVHIPPQLPISGELEFDKLARKYQLAGGYIRNACLRAAFLAAQDETALDQRHLERAVTLEFAELGKLSSSGALD